MGSHQNISDLSPIDADSYGRLLRLPEEECRSVQVWYQG